MDIRYVVQVMADIYDTEPAARAALFNIQYPAASIPAWDKPELFWSVVIQDLDRGRIPDGIALLVAAAFSGFPASRQLHALMAEVTMSSTDTPNGDRERRLIAKGIEGSQTEDLPSVSPRKWPRFARFRRTGDASGISLRDPQNVEFLPATRRLEEIGTTQSDFDNSGSSATSVETLRISNSTQFVLKFDTARATLRSGKSSVSLLDFAKIEGQLQSTLRTEYSLSEKTALTVERTSQINIPAQAHVRVLLSWKRIWQDGVIVVRARSGVDVLVPYSVTVDLIFDKTLTDIPGSDDDIDRN